MRRQESVEDYFLQMGKFLSSGFIVKMVQLRLFHRIKIKQNENGNSYWAHFCQLLAV